MICLSLTRYTSKTLTNFSDLSPEKRYQLTLLNEVLGIAIVWLNQSTGKSIPEIENILLEVGVEQVETKDCQGFCPVMDTLDDVYVEF